MAKDLQDAYLLTYHQPESEAGACWRAIQVVVLGANKPMRVRARTGYQPSEESTLGIGGNPVKNGKLVREAFRIPSAHSDGGIAEKGAAASFRF